MHIDLNDDEAMTLRELLRERVTQLDKQINAADSLRFKGALRDEERHLERILGALNRDQASGPAEWQPRDDATDDPAAPKR
jgi:hypothetical protein